MGKTILFIVFIVLIVISFFIDDDDHGKPHTGYVGEDW